jgi:hypothetical protein
MPSFDEPILRMAREKAAMNRTWAKREKQIETIASTAKFSGSCRRCTVLPPRVAAIPIAGRRFTNTVRGEQLEVLRPIARTIET